MNKVILIGGAPIVGKSYTARKIGEELKLPWISTDTIREQMRKIVNKKDYPHLFVFPNYNAEKGVEFLTKKSAKEIVKFQNEESQEVWKGVKALIEIEYVWRDFIVEGVAILPDLVKELSIKDKQIKAVFLIDNDRERIRKTIFTRGLWADADKYPDSVKEKEVEWVMEFNKYISCEAKKYGYAVIDIGDRKDYLVEIKRRI